MIICVTGATGFIGKPLCKSLVSAGHEVRALTRRQEFAGVEGVAYFCGDIAAPVGNISSFLENADVLFHCAGEVSSSGKMFSLHVEGTLNLVALVEKEIELRGKAVHWVQLSSVGAYGLRCSPPDAHRTVSVDSPELPEDLYEITKTVSDRLVSSYAKKNELFSYTIVRPTIVVGCSMPNQSFFQLTQMVKRRMFFYIGRSMPIANYVHVDDVVEALVCCAFNAASKSKTYLISNDSPYEKVVSAISRYYGVSEPTLRIPEFLVRSLVFLFSSFKAFPLTTNRVDVMMRRTSYISNISDDGLGFVYKRDIPASIDSLLEGTRFARCQ